MKVNNRMLIQVKNNLMNNSMKIKINPVGTPHWSYNHPPIKHLQNLNKLNNSLYPQDKSKADIKKRIKVMKSRAMKTANKNNHNRTKNNQRKRKKMRMMMRMKKTMMSKSKRKAILLNLAIRSNKSKKKQFNSIHKHNKFNKAVSKNYQHK